MTQHLVSISAATLCDRLRVLQGDLTNENRHSDALLIDLAIQVIIGQPDGLDRLFADVSSRVTQAIRNANLMNASFVAR